MFWHQMHSAFMLSVSPDSILLNQLVVYVQCTELDWRPILETAWSELSPNAWCDGSYHYSCIFNRIKMKFWSSWRPPFICKVHHGFYSAYHNTSLGPGILNAVQRTRDVFGDIQVMVTGHSMGGAMASFCALDLTVNLCFFYKS